jgi:hypothetical protein
LEIHGITALRHDAEKNKKHISLCNKNKQA